VESGVIKRLPHGEYVEVHVPPDEDIAARLRGKAVVPMIPAAPDGEGIPPKGMRGPVGRLRALLSKAYGTDHVPLPEDGHEHEEHAAVGAGDQPRELH
jgi:ubiquinol-cytochrome c reductase cytochrome b subunit